MRIQHAICFGLVLAAAAFGSMSTPALAQGVGVRAVGQRPKCDFPDGYVEVFNQDSTYHYKVLVEGTLINDNQGNDTCASGTACLTSFSNERTLVPCDNAGFCQSVSADLPNCQDNAQCTVQTCDNKGNSCPPAVRTCNTPNEHCATFQDLRVTITAYSTDGSSWTSTNDVVCVLGSYGSSPPCQVMTKCTGNPEPLCDFSHRVNPCVQ